MHIKSSGTSLARQKAALPGMKALVQELCQADGPALASLAEKFADWARPRVDLFVLVPAFNRFDDLLRSIVEKYNLANQFALIDAEDELLVRSVLALSAIFIEHGSNRGVYSSIPYVCSFFKALNNGIVIEALKIVSKLLSLRYSSVKKSSWPQALQVLPVDLLCVMAQQQPHQLEYVADGAVRVFTVDERPLQAQLEGAPLESPQAPEIATALRQLEYVPHKISQLYACSVCVLMNAPVQAACLDIVVPETNAARELEIATYDALRDMCFYPGEVPHLRRQVLQTFSNVYLMMGLTTTLEQMEAGTLDRDPIKALLRMLSQIHLGSSAPLPMFLEFAKPNTPRYRDVQTYAMMSLYALLMDDNSTLAPFLELDGLGTIINTLKREVEAEHAPAVERLVQVDYELDYTTIQWIKSLLVIVANVLKHKCTPAIVTQLLNTPILDVLVLIISRPKVYGWLVVTMSVQTLSILVKTESSTTSMLLDTPNGAHVLTKMQPGNKAQNYPPLFQLCAALFNSEQGIELVEQHDLISQLFEGLAGSDLSNYSCLNSIGMALGEISSLDNRYHKPLTTHLIAFTKAVTQRLSWSDPRVGTDGTREQEPPKSSVEMLNLVFMLHIVLENHLMMRQFIHQGGFDVLLDLLCHPFLPYDVLASKEMVKDDYSFSLLLKNMFSLEYETEKLLGTIFRRIERVKVSTFRLDRGYDDEMIKCLADVRTLNMLVHSLDALIGSASPYHFSLAIKHLAKSSVVPSIGVAYKTLIMQLAHLSNQMSEVDLVASWPAAILDCFGIQQMTPEHQQTIDAALPNVGEGFLWKCAARSTLIVAQCRYSMLLSTLAVQLSSEDILSRCLDAALMVCKQLAEVLHSALVVPKKCKFALHYLGQVGNLCNRVLLKHEHINVPVFIFFKQLGLGPLFEAHKQVVLAPQPESFRLYLVPTTPTQHLRMHVQRIYYQLYNTLAVETEFVDRTSLSNPTFQDMGFLLPQALLEARAALLYYLGELAPLLVDAHPRSLKDFCGVLTTLSKECRGADPEAKFEDARDPLFLELDTTTEDREQQVALLMAQGAPEASARKAVRGSYRMAHASLVYDGVIMGPNVGISRNPAEITVDGMPVTNLAAYGQLANQVWQKIIGALVQVRNEDTHFYIASALGKLEKFYGRLFNFTIEANVPLLAALLRIQKFSSSQLQKVASSEHVRIKALEGDAHALFLVEQVLAKGTSDLGHTFFEAPQCEVKWTKNDTLAVFKREWESPLQLVSVARFSLLVCGRDHTLCAAAMPLVSRLLRAVEPLKGDAYGKRLEVCLMLLIPVVLEAPQTNQNYILKQLLDSAADSYALENMADLVGKWQGHLFRSPTLFIQTLASVCVPVERDSPSLVWRSTLQKAHKEAAVHTKDLEPKYEQLSLEMPSADPQLLAPLSKQQQTLLDGLFGPLKDLADGNFTSKDKAVRQAAGHHMIFLLNVLSNLLQCNHQVSLYLFGSGAIASPQKVAKSPRRFGLLIQLVALGGDTVGDAVASAALQAIKTVLCVPRDVGYTAETAQAYTMRCRFVVEVFSKTLWNQFVSVKPSKFVEVLDAKIRLLTGVLRVLVDVIKHPDLRLDKFSKGPIFPACIVEKKLPSVVGMCIARLNVKDPSLTRLLGLSCVFYDLIASYEDQDFDAESDDSEEELMELEFDVESDDDGYSYSSDAEQHAELEAFDPDDSQVPHQHMFRNSTLGMYEHDSEEDHLPGEENYDDYDRISDDEVLSDLDQDQEPEEFSDDGFDDEDFDIDDIEDTLDVENSDDEDDEPNLTIDGDPFDALTDMAYSDESEAEDDVRRRNSSNLLEALDVPLRRFSEHGLARPMLHLSLAPKVTTWLLSPIWVSSQQLAAEQLKALGKVYDPQAVVSCDSLYIPGIDMAEFDRILASWPELKLGSEQFAEMFSYHWVLSTQKIVATLKSKLWTPQSAKLVEALGYWLDQLGWESEDEGEEEEEVDMSHPEIMEEVESVSASDGEAYRSSSPSTATPVVGLDMDGNVHMIASDLTRDNIVADEESLPSPEPVAVAEAEAEPHIITVGGREVNLTALGIDPLFLEALPEAIQQEVLQQYIGFDSGASSDAEDYDDARSDDDSGEEITTGMHPAAQLLLDAFSLESPAPPAEVPELLKRILDAFGKPDKRSRWLTDKPKGKDDDPNNEWPSCIDAGIMDSLVRLLYGIDHGHQFTSQLSDLLANMAHNKTLRDLILPRVVDVFFKICAGQRSAAYAAITQAALSSREQQLKAKPVVYPSNENGDGSEQLHVVTKVLNAVGPQLFANNVDLMAFINQVMAQLDRPLVQKSTQALDWIVSLVGSLAFTYDFKDEYPNSMPPVDNVVKLVGALTYDECSAGSFEHILVLMPGISAVPGVYDLVTQRALKDARRYRQKVLADLRDLHAGAKMQLDLAVQSRLAAPNSPQTKLLRLVTFMDYLHLAKTITDKDERKARYTDLMALFKQLNLYPVWQELGICLDLIGQQDFKSSTALLPLIECLTGISKRVLNSDRESSYSGWLKVHFLEFTLKHRRTLNYLVRLNPKLLSGSFAILSKDSRILDFDNKLKYFNRRARDEKQQLGHQLLRIAVNRDNVFLDTYRALFYKQASEIKRFDIQINFQGEEGVDAGGVTREWYECLSRGIFNPDYALFVPISENSTIFHPNASSWVNPEHLSFFQFVGRIIGKAVYDGRIMSCYFSTALYKRLLRKPVELSDFEAVDQEYYKSLVWMLNNDITDIITETFSVEKVEFGETKVVELVPNGENIPVTEENKRDYVQRIVQYQLIDSVEQQLEMLAKGFDEMIPDKIRPVFYELFDERELELLICGLPGIDLDDWRNNTTYINYSASSPHIKWFWRAVSSFNMEERAKLLQFCTGTSKVPVGGFSQLETTNNAPKFTITRDFGSNKRWPSAHTCTNQLDLPLYDSYDDLRSALFKAIIEGSGFGFA